MVETFKEKNLWEKYKELIGITEEATEEQKAEFERVKKEIEAEGMQTGEAAQITGEDLADFITTFGSGGAFKFGTKFLKIEKLAKEVVGKGGKEGVDILLKNLKNVKDTKIAEGVTSKGFRDLLGDSIKDPKKITQLFKEPIKEAGELITEKGVKVTSKTYEKLGKEAKDVLFKNAERIAGAKTASKLAARTGMEYEKAVKLIKSQKVQNLVKDMSRGKLAKIGLGGTGIGAATGLALKGIGFTVGLDVLTNWAALDNVMGQQSILIRDVVSSASRGDVDIKWAREQVIKAEEIISVAEGKISQSIKYDPFLIFSKKIWQAGIDSNKHSITTQLAILDELEKKQIPEEEFETTSREDILRKQLETETDPDRRASIMGDLEWIERNKQKDVYDPLKVEQEALEKRKAEESKKAKEAEYKARQKDRASVGIKGLAQTPYEQKKREVPSKLGFGL